MGVRASALQAICRILLKANSPQCLAALRNGSQRGTGKIGWLLNSSGGASGFRLTCWDVCLSVFSSWTGDFVGRFCHVIKKSWKAGRVMVGKLPVSENCQQFSFTGTNGNKSSPAKHICHGCTPCCIYASFTGKMLQRWKIYGKDEVVTAKFPSMLLECGCTEYYLFKRHRKHILIDVLVNQL